MIGSHSYVTKEWLQKTAHTIIDRGLEDFIDKIKHKMAASARRGKFACDVVLSGLSESNLELYQILNALRGMGLRVVELSEENTLETHLQIFWD